MRLAVTLLVGFVTTTTARAYDSVACGPPDVRADCEGLEAARTPWFKSEHAQIWLRSRVLAGLPEAVDQPFEVVTPTLGLPADADWSTVVPAPLDLATTLERRTVEIATFAQLPDKSWGLWDWASGHEGCPPLGGDDIDGCHAFTAHMGWLNSNHFLPQAEDAFHHHHSLALERAASCAAMAARLGDHTVVQACDREALLLEAVAHHYLQDAWSMGHMWQRWGSPELSDFSTALAGDPGLVSVKALGDAVGRASGIIHGAGAITGLPDAMCAPDTGVDFLHGEQTIAGAGDLFLERVQDDDLLFDQRELLFGCAATAMREVYEASARSLGPLRESSALDIDLVDCFPQRATNRAIGLGAAIQLPAIVADEILDIPIRAASDAYLAALGLPPAVGVDYIPLTSSILSAIRIDIPGIVNAGLINREITDRWNEDMGGIQFALRFEARTDPNSSTLANGAMGPLLGMRPNAAYLGVPSYTDPPLPWRPSLMVVPPEPRVEAAADLLSRTFVEAHADDWCAVLSVDGQDEFSVDWLRRRCSALTIQDDPDADVACSVCTRMAEWFVVAQPDDAVDPELLLPGVCSLLAGHEGIPVSSRHGDDRTALAARWCGPAVALEGLSVEPLQGCEGDPDATMIHVRVVDLDGEPVAGVRVTFSLDDVTVGSGTSNDDGVAEYLYDEADNALRVVKADVNGADVAGEFFIVNAGESCAACPGTVITQDDVDACGATECRHDDEACNAELGCACAFACPDIGFACGCAFDATVGAVMCGCCCGCT